MMRAAWAAAALMSACTLHATPPLFGPQTATPLLGMAPLTLTDGATRLDLIPSGQDYTTANTPAQTIRFVALHGGGHVMQTVTGDRAHYALATWDGQTLLTRPLDCMRLKTDLRTNPLVQLADNGCRLRPGTDPLAAFATILTTAPTATGALTRP